MKYYIISGEASGDLHGSNLLKEINKLDKQANVRAWGGDLLEEQGAKLVKHYRDLAFMGFAEVIMNLRTILNNISFCKNDILQFKPDVLILIDYPGFNLRIAEWAKNEGFKIFYYISPQIWAWKEARVHTIKKVVDEMFVILPFEQEFYKKYNFPVHFLGHPLLDAIENRKQNEKGFEQFVEENKLSGKKIIALLPGSRKQEINKMLGVMLKMPEKYPQFEFVIAGAPSMPASFYEPFLKNYQTKILFGKTYELLENAHAALVTSGTATLETALFEVPEVVCYSGNAISIWIARQLVKIKFISLTNLIVDREIVKELIQDEFNETNLQLEFDKILDEKRRIQIKSDYRELKEKLGGVGASAKIAQLMVENLKKKI